MDVDRTTSKWKVVINPQEYEIEVILNDFFNTTTERGGGDLKKVDNSKHKKLHLSIVMRSKKPKWALT